MKRLKIWFFDRFFPAYVDESLREHIRALERENDRLRAYLRGVEVALRSQRKIQIRNEVK